MWCGMSVVWDSVARASVVPCGIVFLAATPADPDAQGDTVMEGEMATLSCALQDGVADKTEWIGT